MAMARAFLLVMFMVVAAFPDISSSVDTSCMTTTDTTEQRFCDLEAKLAGLQLDIERLSTCMATRNMEPMCLPGFEYHASFGCLQLSNPLTSTDYYEATRTCEDNGGKLVFIDSSRLSDFLQAAITNELSSSGMSGRIAVWMSLIRWETGSGDQFVRDSTGQRLTWSNWAEGQPNNFGGNQNCVVSMCGGINNTCSEFQWHDYQCNIALPYSKVICQHTLCQ